MMFKPLINGGTCTEGILMGDVTHSPKAGGAAALRDIITQANKN
jgi:hypothetical protein